MAFFNKLFRGGAGQDAVSDAAGRASFYDRKCWTRVLAPSAGRPYSMRGLEVACRLAHTSNATVHLAYILEVPRSLPIEASIPDDEALAASVLADGEDIAGGYHVPVVSTIYRTRNTADGIVKLIREASCDLLVLGARPDEMRGLPRDLTRQLFLSAPCEVVLDYIAGEQ
jgi:nucleotide-binding universal stress UspA family protein